MGVGLVFKDPQLNSIVVTHWTATFKKEKEHNCVLIIIIY